jgi:hypothetical protein
MLFDYRTSRICVPPSRNPRHYSLSGSYLFVWLAQKRHVRLHPHLQRVRTITKFAILFLTFFLLLFSRKLQYLQYNEDGISFVNSSNNNNNNNTISNNNNNHHHTSYSNNNSNNSNRCSQNSLTESRILEMKRQEQRESYGRQLEEARMKRDSANFLSTSSSEHHLYTGPTMTLTEQNLLLSSTHENSTTHGLDDHSFAGQQQVQTTPEKFELVIPGSKPNSFIGRGSGGGEHNGNNTSNSTFVISSSSLSKNSALFKSLEGIGGGGGGGGSRAASVDSPDKRSATTSSIGEMFQKIISRGGATIYPQSPKHGNSREIMKQDDDNNDPNDEEENGLNLDRHKKKKDEKELLPQQQQQGEHDNNEEQQSETTEKINHAPSQGDHRDVASMKTLEMV